MELRPDRLERQLASEPLRPVYLVAGAEPLLVQEAADAIRARAREEGYGGTSWSLSAPMSRVGAVISAGSTP